MNGVLATVKTYGPSSIKRKKVKFELYNPKNEVGPGGWDAIPAPPITPPAAFLPGYKRISKKGNNLTNILNVLFFR